jgi:long-chain fatty acid transport protein
MNTKYKGANTFGAGSAGVDLKQLFIAGTYAQKIDDKSSWGVTPVLVYQMFKATGLGSFAGFSVDPANVSDNGVSTSTGYGLKLGAQSEVNPGVTIAGAYQSKMTMSKFDDYAGLFADDGSFDIPSTITLGLAWAVTSNNVFTADIQKINYSEIDSIANPQALQLGGCTPGAPAVGATCLGGSNGTGFGWEDMTIIKLGYQWAGSDGYTWRAGISNGKQPIPDEETMFNIIAPAVIETHITFGFTKEIGSENEFNFAAMYAPSASVKGDNPLVAPGSQTIELEMSQWELEGSYSMKF